MLRTESRADGLPAQRSPVDLILSARPVLDWVEKLSEVPPWAA